MFQLALWRFDELKDWEASAIEGSLNDLAREIDCRLRDLIRPFYIAVCGRPQSVPVIQSMAIIGRDMTRERLRQALTRLGGVRPEETSNWRMSLEEQFH